MKLLPILLVVAGGALGYVALRAPEPTYTAPRQVPRELPEDLPEGTVVRAFDVQGMCCEGCSEKLFAAALEVPGVSGAAVRFEREELRVVCDPATAPDVVARALSFGKYTVAARP